MAAFLSKVRDGWKDEFKSLKLKKLRTSVQRVEKRLIA
jgi:hypothetical protein